MRSAREYTLGILTPSDFFSDVAIGCTFLLDYRGNCHAYI